MHSLMLAHLRPEQCVSRRTRRRKTRSDFFRRLRTAELCEALTAQISEIHFMDRLRRAEVSARRFSVSKDRRRNFLYRVSDSSFFARSQQHRGKSATSTAKVAQHTPQLQIRQSDMPRKRAQ